MYIKSKPDKYGLKLFSLNDPSKSYLIYAIPYLGKIQIIDLLQGEKLSEYYLRKVTAPIHGTKRTVTCDNWFTSIPLLQHMKGEEPYDMRMNGTIRKNKQEIPAEMKVASKNPPDWKFCHTDSMSLVSYSPEKNQIVLVISTDKLSTDVQNQKAMMAHYHSAKGGTDCFDWLCSPMRVFMGMLDQASNKKTKMQCPSCLLLMCAEYRTLMCTDCAGVE
ncbi:hypothetical protein TKK_0014524 [Trichogramma kaykai]